MKGEGRLLEGLLVVGAGNCGVSFEHREAVSHGIDLTTGTVPGQSRQYLCPLLPVGNAVACKHNRVGLRDLKRLTHHVHIRSTLLEQNNTFILDVVLPLT